ncbi:hypothetical protein ACNQR7_07100 [Mycolicibacterium senegalense]|uniref:hypothetical protein n=1 Tax=Mycolicibacterium TaxID=1866885 RepID=UPI003204DEC8
MHEHDTHRVLGVLAPTRFGKYTGISITNRQTTGDHHRAIGTRSPARYLRTACTSASTAHATTSTSSTVSVQLVNPNGLRNPMIACAPSHVKPPSSAAIRSKSAGQGPAMGNAPLDQPVTAVVP